MNKKKLKDITISELRRFCHNRGANCWKYPTCPIFEIDGCFGETLNDLEQEIEIPEEVFGNSKQLEEAK